jgi:hypothetical protein
MPSFRYYYRNQFQRQLATVLAKGWKGHEQHGDEPGSIIQPRTLSLENPAIRRMSAESQARFAVALYLTILTDQVASRYFREHYAKFAALTRYPKFRGDCPGGCRSSVPAERILLSIGMEVADRAEAVPPHILTELQAALPDLRYETTAFVQDHMPELGESFWTRCTAEPPLVTLPVPGGDGSRGAVAP